MKAQKLGRMAAMFVLAVAAQPSLAGGGGGASTPDWSRSRLVIDSTLEVAALKGEIASQVTLGGSPREGINFADIRFSYVSSGRRDPAIALIERAIGTKLPTDEKGLAVFDVDFSEYVMLGDLASVDSWFADLQTAYARENLTDLRVRRNRFVRCDRHWTGPVGSTAAITEFANVTFNTRSDRAIKREFPILKRSIVLQGTCAHNEAVLERILDQER